MDIIDTINAELTAANLPSLTTLNSHNLTDRHARVANDALDAVNKLGTALIRRPISPDRDEYDATIDHNRTLLRALGNVWVQL